MLKQAKKYTLDKAEDMYGVEDSVFRLAVYMDRLDKGFSPEDAALDARKWFIDYDISAPFIVGLKRTILPFVSYTYRVMPLLAEGVIMRPHKLAKWAALGYGMNAIGQGIAGEDKADDEIQRLTMRDSQNKRMFSGVPIIGENMPYTQVRLPFNSVNGDPLFLDVERWIPGGDVFSQRETSEVGIPGLPAPLQPGGIYVDAIANFVFKVDPFTGNEIDQSEGGMPLLRHFLKRIPPNIPGIPGTFATEKLKKARSPDDIITNPNFQDSYFTSPSGYWESLAYTFGIKLRPQNLKVNQDVKDLENDKKVKELDNRRYKLENDFRQQKVTEEEYKKKLTKLEEESIKLAAEYEIYLNKVRDLQEAKSQRAMKYSGGIIGKMSKRKGYRDGLSVEKDVPDVEADPADRSVDGTGQSFKEVAGQDTEPKTPEAVTNIPLTKEPINTPIEENIVYNNPGNIEEGQGFAGETGEVYAIHRRQEENKGAFVVFDSPEAGLRAVVRDLTNKINDFDGNLQAIVSKYAPPKDNNPTTEYFKYLQQKVGNKSIVTLEDLPQLLEGIVEFENKPTKEMTPQQRQQAQARVDKYLTPSIFNTALAIGQYDYPTGTTTEQMIEDLTSGVFRTK